MKAGVTAAPELQGPRAKMRMPGTLIALFLACVLLPLTSPAAKAQQPLQSRPNQENAEAVIWSDPGDIRSRNLLYGAGGQEHEPRGPMTFVEEDREGSNPKFDVRDQQGTKWKAKMGVEAKPETAAAHLLWAAGYFTDEDFFLPKLTVEGMPAQLHRGQNLVESNGTLENVRLERKLKGWKKAGSWQWKKNPFSGSQKLNGLRVMMALMNSWDLKDENNAIYEKDGGADEPQKIYLVSDIGASFGTTGYSWSQGMAKGNLKSYEHSKFIGKVHSEFVDFNSPSRPALIYFFDVPGLVTRLRMRWIGRHIPREDARWMGQILSGLSSEQIHDAFRSAGYSNQEVERFSKVVQDRIAQLTKL